MEKLAKKSSSETRSRIEMESQLVRMCIDAATCSGDTVEAWRRQRRSLERMPPQLAEALLHRLLHRRLLFPSLLEVFKHSIEEIDLRGENCVDAEWMAYLGAFRYLRSLNLADCHKVNSAALWAVTGMSNLEELDLSRCSKITDAGVRHLLSIPSLEKLCISETGVTANGVILLSSLTNLSKLDLGGLPVSDLALNYLQGLKNLQYLDLWGSEISNEGAAVFHMFSRLTFLNIAWTKVTKLPNLSSLTCLNMSNCNIDSLFEGDDKVPLAKLMLSGTTFADVSEALSHIDSGCLSVLDISNSSVESFFFLRHMSALTYLDLGGCSMVDSSVEHIACIGANLRYLNLSSTSISSAGVGILAGHVPNLETLSLSCTSTDDTAISYIGMMPSLKVVNLKSTQIKGLIHEESLNSNWVPSFSALQNLSYLERLELEGTQIRDVALCPLSSLRRLSYLSVGSGFLTDASLHHLSSVENLVNLRIRDAVLTNAGLHSFCPPRTLKVLDLWGCWLLTKDAILLFSKKCPKLELRHDLVDMIPADKSGSTYPSPSRVTPSTRWLKQRGKMPISPPAFNNSAFLDQRLKYTRAELLALQFSSASFSLG